MKLILKIILFITAPLWGFAIILLGLALVVLHSAWEQVSEIWYDISDTVDSAFERRKK